MEFDGHSGYYNNFEDRNNMLWSNEGYGGPDNFGLRNHINNGRGRGRGRGGYGRNSAQGFGPGAPFNHDPRQRFFWGRGYGPAGPPLQPRTPKYDATMVFLIRCGVLKQTLKGLPKVLLHLMQPENCGVCAQEFDYFDGARLHYISKNHSKNVKKWVAQQAKVGSQSPKQIPLKARELYCELCDIHITSKTHAESHYAGRLHRAIVEGRKIPKNPFLLQENMQNRVQQLIRREKKCLKPVDESVEREKPKMDAKLIPPELYCKICKTSVTCTEQMTMHLNGKKHLSKEKRHIFNMMKAKPAKTANTVEDADAQGENGKAQGEDANAQSKDANAQSKDANAHSKDANAQSKDANAQGEKASEKGETNNYEDEFDWGHGSGTWDDDPQ